MAKNIIQLLSFYLFFITAYSQDYQRVDKIVGSYPVSFHTPLDLANKIKQDFTSESDKARAVFTWMALNISYDMEAYLNPKPSKSFSFKNEEKKYLKLYKIRNKEINTVFRKHKGVCSGYSLLYYHLASLVGLHAQIIDGDSKTKTSDIGKKRVEMNHAWNAVMIDGIWRLVDVTWGAGETINENNLWVKKFKPIYFDTDPKMFFANHLPVSKIWNNKTIDETLFLQSPLLYSDYFEKEVEILEPKFGVIEVEGNQKINFKIKNRYRFQEIGYRMNSDPLIVVNPTTVENDIEQFDIDYHKKEGRYITIYVSRSAIAVFKIMPKRKS
nr:transglutaminase domain-containing protein [uncultured Flavobacterium sp.]